MHPRPYPPEALLELAREAFAASGLTQMQVAEHIGKSQPSVAKALAGASNLLGVRIQIIEAFTPYVVEGPSYTLRLKTEAEAGGTP